jgi:excisionase family DNA binding protein
MAADGRLTVTKVGKHRRIHIDDLNDLIERGRRARGGE